MEKMKHFHVQTTTGDTGVTTGTLSAQEMNAANPAIYHFMETQDTDFCQFQVGKGYVTVERKSPDKL
jgi:hypothetical protein